MNVKILISLFCLTLTVATFTADSPTLWQKAVAIQAANMDWIPGTMTMTFELLDKKGQPDMTDFTSYKITLNDSGEAKTEIVSALHNGKDVTDKRKEEMAKEEAKSSKQEKEENETENSTGIGFSLKDSPLHPDNQEIISVTLQQQDSTIDGKQCALFRYSLPLKEHTKEGAMWIDTATGAPVLHEYYTTPLPPKVKKMKNRVRYQYKADSMFVVTQTQFEGVGGVLFIKKSFRGTMTFGDYLQNTK